MAQRAFVSWTALGWTLIKLPIDLLMGRLRVDHMDILTGVIS